jgi:hypothetical protein
VKPLHKLLPSFAVMFVLAEGTQAHSPNQLTIGVAANSPIPSTSGNEIINQAKLSPAIRLAAYSIIRRVNVWANKSVLTVCFGPSDAVTSRKQLIDNIVSIANEWTDGISIKFDFGTPYRVCTNVSSADIRVDIHNPPSNGEVFQSLIGNVSEAQYIEGAEPFSMQLLFPDGVAYYTRPEVLKFYVLHEFGHALGAEHEHQRVDCKFNYSYIASHFGFPDASTAKANMQQIFSYRASAYPQTGATEDSQFIATKYDNYSIMKYNLSTSAAPTGDDPGVYTDGTKDICYRADWVSQLTPYDKAGMAEAYAEPVASAAAIASLADVVGRAGLSATAKAKLRQYSIGTSEGAAAPSPNGGTHLGGLQKQVNLVRTSPSAMHALSQALELRAAPP